MSANTVDVDAAALIAEAQRAVAGAALDPAAAAAIAADPNAAPAAPAMDSWRPLIEGMTPTVRMTIFAQWQIAPDMQAEFVASLSQSLDLLFPGGMDGKYAPFVRLLACCAGIAFMNYTPADGLKPLGLKKPDDKKPDAGAQKQAA